MSRGTRDLNVDAIRWAMRQQTRDARAKLLLCVIAAAVDEQGRCTLGVNGLARACEMSIQVMLRKLHHLEELRLLAKHPTKSTTTGADQYRFRLIDEGSR